MPTFGEFYGFCTFIKKRYKMWDGAMYIHVLLNKDRYYLVYLVVV